MGRVSALVLLLFFYLVARPHLGGAEGMRVRKVIQFEDVEERPPAHSLQERRQEAAQRESRVQFGSTIIQTPPLVSKFKCPQGFKKDPKGKCRKIVW